jgi:hypothetical protein
VAAGLNGGCGHEQIWGSLRRRKRQRRGGLADQPERGRRESIGALANRDDHRHDPRDVLLDELDLSDQRWQRGRVADPESEQYDTEQEQRDGMTSSEEEGERSEDLNEVTRAGKQATVSANRHQPSK